MIHLLAHFIISFSHLYKHKVIVVEWFTYYSKLQQYILKEKEEKPDVVETPGNAASEVVALEKEEGTTAADSASEVSDEATPTAAGGESTEANPDDAENGSEAATEETSEDTENSGDEEEAEETPEVKVVDLTIPFQ